MCTCTEPCTVQTICCPSRNTSVTTAFAFAGSGKYSNGRIRCDFIQPECALQHTHPHTGKPMHIVADLISMINVWPVVRSPFSSFPALCNQLPFGDILLIFSSLWSVPGDRQANARARALRGSFVGCLCKLAQHWKEMPDVSSDTNLRGMF